MRSLLLLLLTLILTGCAQHAPRPALISHVVFIEVHDKADIPMLLAESDAALASIPGVVSYAAGEHLETGRPTVLHDYDLGLYIGFDSESAYAEYVSHPAHVGFVERWKPRLKALRVYDIHDPTR